MSKKKKIWFKSFSCSCIISIIALGVSLGSCYAAFKANNLATEANSLAQEANEIAKKHFETNLSVQIADGRGAAYLDWTNKKRQENIEFRPPIRDEDGPYFSKDYYLLISNLGARDTYITNTQLTNLVTTKENMNVQIWYRDEIYGDERSQLLDFNTNEKIDLPINIGASKSIKLTMRITYVIPRNIWELSGLQIKEYKYYEAEKAFEDAGFYFFGLRKISTQNTELDFKFPNQRIGEATPSYQAFCLRLSESNGKSIVIPIHENISETFDKDSRNECSEPT